MYILLFIQSFYIQLKESIARYAIVVIIGTTFNRNILIECSLNGQPNL